MKLFHGNTLLFVEDVIDPLSGLAALAMLFQAVSVSERAIVARYDISAADNLRARKIYTQVHVIGKMVHILIGVFAVSSVLMLFDAVRHIGSSLLASAGVVGIVAGIEIRSGTNASGTWRSPMHATGRP